jgi:hypothetical protein
LTYNLDTNIVVALLRNRPARVRERNVVSDGAIAHRSRPSNRWRFFVYLVAVLGITI